MDETAAQSKSQGKGKMTFSHSQDKQISDCVIVRECVCVLVGLPGHVWLLVSWPCPCLAVSSADLCLH